MKIEIVWGCPRHSQSQGLVEQANETVEDQIAKWKCETGSSNWSKALTNIQLSINNTKQESTKCTPFVIIFGRLTSWCEPSNNEIDILINSQEAPQEGNEQDNDANKAVIKENTIIINSSIKKQSTTLQCNDENPLQGNHCKAELVLVQQKIKISQECMVRKYGKGHNIQTFDIGDIVSLKFHALIDTPLTIPI